MRELDVGDLVLTIEESLVCVLWNFTRKLPKTHALLDFVQPSHYVSTQKTQRKHRIFAHSHGNKSFTKDNRSAPNLG